MGGAHAVRAGPAPLRGLAARRGRLRGARTAHPRGRGGGGGGAAPRPRGPPPPTALAVLAPARIAVMVIGLASLVPIDRDMDVYDTLTAMLIMLLPLLLAGGFAWPREARRSVRAICWTIAACDLLLVSLPPVFAIAAAATA